jgi:hypothetical protein
MSIIFKFLTFTVHPTLHSLFLKLNIYIFIINRQNCLLRKLLVSDEKLGSGGGGAGGYNGGPDQL